MILSIDTVRYMFKTIFDSFPQKKSQEDKPATCIGSQNTQPTWQSLSDQRLWFGDLHDGRNHPDISWFQFGKFGERTISYVKMWNRLIETPISMFQTNDGHIFFTWFETTISSWNFNVFPPPSSTSSPKGLACNHGSLGCWCCSSRNLKDLGDFAQVLGSRVSVAVTWRERRRMSWGGNDVHNRGEGLLPPEK